MDRETVGLNIRLARTRENMTQEQLAELADISTSYISAIERGKQSVSLEYMNRIANALKIPVSDLLVHEGERYRLQSTKPDITEDADGGKYILRQKKMNQIIDVLSKCSDREFQIAYDEIILLMNKFKYINDKGLT